MATTAPTKQVYEIGGRKINTTSLQRAQQLYQSEWGALPTAPVASPTATMPNPATSGPFPVNQLATAPLTMAPAVPPTAAASAGGYFESQSKNLQQLYNQQQQQAAVAQQGVNQDLTGLRGIYEQLIDQPQRGEEIRSELGVDEKLNEVNNFTSQIEAEQLASRRAIERIEKNKDGMSAGGITTEVNRIEKESISKQADLAVLQSAAARNYDAAAAAADRKIAVETEGLQLRLDAQKFFYQENKDKLTKAEDKAWQIQIAEGEQELALITEGKKIAQNLIIEAASLGAPTSLLQQAQAAYNAGQGGQQIAAMLGSYTKTALEAQATRASIANTYSQIGERNASGGDDVDTYAKAYELGQVTLTQIPQKIRGAVLAQAQESGTNRLVGLLGQYRDRAEGLNFLTANLPSNKAQLDTLKGQITAVYKQQQQLGTLDNGVQVLVDKIIPDPSKPSISSLSNKAQIGAIDTFIANQGGAVAADGDEYAAYLKAIGQ